MDFIFIAVLFVIFIALILLFIVSKYLLNYFVIEISKDLTTLTIHNSWFFQEDLLLFVKAEKIEMTNYGRVAIDGLITIKKTDSEKADYYFKLSKKDGGNRQFIDISKHANCRYVCR